MKHKDDEIGFQVYIPVELRERLKEYAKAEGRQIKWVVRKAIEDKLEREDQK